jgi:hypothetical protein
VHSEQVRLNRRKGIDLDSKNYTLAVQLHEYNIIVSLGARTILLATFLLLLLNFILKNWGLINNSIAYYS